LIFVGIRRFRKPVTGFDSKTGVIASKFFERWYRVGGNMRSMKMAALAVAITLTFSGLALARDHDDHKHDHWDKHVDHHNESSHIWNHSSIREHERARANDGYYGNSRVSNPYPSGGYGYPSGGYGYPSGGYGYPSGGYGYPGGGYGYPSSGRGGYGGGGASSAGYNQGMQDGSYQARKDVSQGKSFNPYPRGSSHSDHGYHSDMGDKHVYQASYDRGYQSGYQSNYGGGGRRGGGF
jgi:hypothetical protein